MNGDYLMMMCFIGVFGFLLLSHPSVDFKNKWVKVTAVMWGCIWFVPPMAIIWIRGVMG